MGDEVVGAFIEIKNKIQPGVVILNQYTSYTLNQNIKLADFNLLTNNILEKIKEDKNFSSSCVDKIKIQQILNGIKNYNHHHLKSEILNAERWMIYSSADD